MPLYANNITFHEAGELMPIDPDPQAPIGTLSVTVFECGDCGALVTPVGVTPHAAHHSSLEELELSIPRFTNGPTG